MVYTILYDSLIGNVYFYVAGDTTRQRIKFSDDRVCKSHLLNCCPHDVLSGTVRILYS